MEEETALECKYKEFNWGYVYLHFVGNEYGTENPQRLKRDEIQPF